MTQPSIRLVVFDWAGTAVDFGCCGPARAFQDAFAEAGVAVSMAEARGPMGMAKKEHLRAMLREPALAARWADVKGRPWEEADVDRLYQRVTPMQIAAAARLGEPVPGLLDAVMELRRAGVRIAGTTGYFREAAEAARATAARYGYVPDANCCADDVPLARPAPWMLFRVMEQTGVYPAHCVLKVGDTPIDIAEGRNAGAWSIGVLDGSNVMGLAPDEFARLGDAERQARREQARAVFAAAGAHGAVDSLAQLPGFVRALNARLQAGHRPSLPECLHA